MEDKRTRCAVYTRKSSEEGLERAFNSLHAQREACEAYILSQKHEDWEVISKEYDDGGFSGGTMERPGLKRLLADIAAKLVDTVVVYKVDRLTRSLPDFARIEREVTGERIRDKIAASKRKAMWMGGVIPLGYDLKDRLLVINKAEAERVREIYRLHLELGCVSTLQTRLEELGIRSKKRLSKTGRTFGGVAFSRGSLHEMLQNPLYVG